MIIGLISQKGGVGKSTLARAVAREYVMNEWAVMVADMDQEQQSCLGQRGHLNRKLRFRASRCCRGSI